MLDGDQLVMPDGSIVLGVKLPQAARMAGVSYKTAYRHVRSGLLRAVKRGKDYLISIGELRKYIGVRGGDSK